MTHALKCRVGVIVGITNYAQPDNMVKVWSTGQGLEVCRKFRFPSDPQHLHLTYLPVFEQCCKEALLIIPFHDK
jgi:hypothetical protein